MHSKVKLSIKTTFKDKLYHNKQIRALMPNLIYSLDATSMSLLRKQFLNVYQKEFAQLYAIHGFFWTTCDKVFVLKTILASVYTDLYSSNLYLLEFDNCVFDYIEKNTHYKVDRTNRIIMLNKGKYMIHEVALVLNTKLVSSKVIKKIDIQHIFV